MKKEANEFFEQLAEFSHRWFSADNIEARESPWGYERFTTREPAGAIIHYTADNDLHRVVRYFMDEKINSRVSAHVVVADRKYAGTAKMEDGLPLIKALPVTIVQCRSPTKPAWHATWTNKLCYGIELLNVGELRVKDGKFRSHWRYGDNPKEPEWTMPWTDPFGKQPTPGWNRFWEPFSRAQVESCVTVLRNLKSLYHMQPSWVLGHENVQGYNTPGLGLDKRDMGPLFPLHHVRGAVFGLPPGGKSWLAEFEANPAFANVYRDKIVGEWLVAHTGQIAPTNVAWLRLASALQAFPLAHNTILLKCALSLLGYEVSAFDIELREVDKTSIWFFQKLSGLESDKIPGPVTRSALVARLIDRGIVTMEVPGFV